MERRRHYIQSHREQLGEQHSLLQLVCQCLHNTPAQRPSAEELLQQLEAMRPQIKGKFTKLQAVMISVLEEEVGEKDGEIACLRHDLRHIQVRVYTCSFLCYTYDCATYWLQAAVEAKDTQLQQQDAQLQQKDTQLEQKDTQLQHKDSQIQQQTTDLRERTLQLNMQTTEKSTDTDSKGMHILLYGKIMSPLMLWLLGEQKMVGGRGGHQD